MPEDIKPPANINVIKVHKPEGQVRVGLCVPMRGGVDSGFMASFVNLTFHILQKPNTLPLPIFSEMVPCDCARNEISKQAILSQCDYLLWLDSDTIMSPQMFDHMWESLHTPEPDGTERSLVCGIYYARAPPYNPVLRKFHKFHRYFDPENIMFTPVIAYPEDRLFEVDGAGMGCCLMRRKVLDLVFNDTKGHPFQFVNDKVSEDLFFFCKLREGVKDFKGVEHKYKVWVDPFAQCVHVGASVSQWHYKHAMADRYIDVDELAAFTKEEPEAVLQKCLDAGIDVMEQWVAKFGKDRASYAKLTKEEIDAFYLDLDYRYDLTYYWFGSPKRRESILAKFAFQPDKPVSVMDFGCGIGDFGLNIAERYPESKVIFFDINRKNLEYLRWRIACRLKDGRMKEDQAWVMDSPDLLKKLDGVKFDVIFCLDVLEHIKEPKEYIGFLRTHLKPQGLLFCQVAPMRLDQPQHISRPDLRDFGFIELDELTYCLPENEVAKKVAEFSKKGVEV